MFSIGSDDSIDSMESIESSILTPSITNYHSEGPPNLKTKRLKSAGRGKFEFFTLSLRICNSQSIQLVEHLFTGYSKFHLRHRSIEYIFDLDSAKLGNIMYIPKLRYPGHIIDHPDNKWGSKVRIQLTSLEQPLAAAALALEWFEKTQSLFESDLLSRESPSETTDAFFPIPARAADDLPWSYKRQLPFVHAHTFLYSLDRIDRTLQVLLDFFDGSYDISNIYKDFQDSIPDLRGVRNSSAHIDDRMQGLGPNKKPIVPNPFGFIILENLHGTKFMSTMANGNLGKVDVTVDTLKASETAIQAVIDLLKWKGMPHQWP